MFLTGEVAELWYDALTEAFKNIPFTISDESTQHLIGALIEHTSSDQAGGHICEIIAFRVCEAESKTGKMQDILLREIGDQCLLLTGLFPNWYHRRNVSAGYYLANGQTAYDTLARKNAFHGAFEAPAREFLKLVRVLHQVPYTQRFDPKFLTVLRTFEKRSGDHDSHSDVH